MFTHQWFSRHQKLLLKLANTFIGKRILGFHLNQTKARKIVKITPNSIHWIEGDKIKAEFLTDNQYSKRLLKILYPLWFVLHLWDWIWYPRFNLGFDTLTSNPDSNPETTSVDGRVFKDGVDLTWANIHDPADGDGAQDAAAATQHIYIKASNTSSQWASLYRSYYLFDTSSLGSGATISTAVFSVYVTAIDNDFGGNMDLITTTPASNTALAAADYDQVGTTLQATSIAIVSLSTSAYNDWTLNATGLGNVSKTSITKFGARMSQDTVNSPPTWSASVDGGVTANYSDVGSNKPKLVVTYTPAFGGIYTII